MINPGSLLGPWSGFYTMIGSSAAALIGLMFVVITLVTSGTERRKRSREGTATFSTPTVVHFSSVLLVAAVQNAPWQSLLFPRLILGAAAAFGLAYVTSIALRIRRMDTYDADTEDWAWHTLLPFLAYAAILVGALLTGTPIAGQALFAIAFAVVTMLFVGIHNAWDIVTFMSTGGFDEADDPSEAER